MIPRTTLPYLFSIYTTYNAVFNARHIRNRGCIPAMLHRERIALSLPF